MEVQSATGRRFAAVSGHAVATAAARDAFDDGGSVADAAIAGAAMLTVALPQACGLGGDCFILMHIDDVSYCLNGSGPAPALLPADTAPERRARGPLSCTVPGMLGAWAAMHQRFGALPWARLMQPAINGARTGLAVSRDFSQGMTDNLDALRADPGSRRYFLDGDEPRAAGRNFAQPALAEAFEAIAGDGAAALYGGRVGASLCKTVEGLGGALRLADLEGYSPVWTEPLEYSYRGYVVRVPPPNSFGAAMLLQLSALEGLDLSDFAIGSAERLHILMSAAKLAFAEARDFVVDPALAGAMANEALGPASVQARQRHLMQVVEAGVTAPTVEAPRSHGTATISVADGSGNAVIIIQSIFAPFGSLVTDPETGIVPNNRVMGFASDPAHPNGPAGGKRPAHTLSPSVVLRDGRLRFVLGTPGGLGQTITLSQVLTNMVDDGLALAPAIAERRWAMDIQGNFVIEREMDEALLPPLAAAGIEVRRAAAEQRFFFGSAECIAADDQGVLKAAADFRREAAAAAN